MSDNHVNAFEEITCENVTDVIVASYAQRGYAMVFAEEVMSYDLSQGLPHVVIPPELTFHAWNAENSHDFFVAFEASFRDRPGFPGWSEEAWISWTADATTFRPDLSYLAVVQAQAVGFITNEDDDTSSEPAGYINQIGVYPQWRRQGIGAVLVARSLQAWQAVGKKVVTLHVNVNNPGAKSLFQEVGFVVVGRRGKFRKQ
jgi:ribosomal protein S18 acetylase RimI-like enzyme